MIFYTFKIVKHFEVITSTWREIPLFNTKLKLNLVQ